MKIRLLPLFPLGMLFTPLPLHAQSCGFNVPSGSVTLANTAVTYCSMTVAAGATLVIGGSVTMALTGNADIEGLIDGVGFGYGSSFASSSGPGAGGNTGINTGPGGGGHGGAGGGGIGATGTPLGNGGPTNDNPSNPVLMGSAGGGKGSGGITPLASSGGAAFLLTVPSGNVSINGTIDMSGFNGGAGGTISIVAQNIFSNGLLKADGSKNGSLNGGGGGGGLIFLCSSANPLSGSGTYSVAGGAGVTTYGVNFSNPRESAAGSPGIYTVCSPPTPTPTSSPTPAPIDTFYVSRNAFTPSQESVSIFIETNQYPGSYSLRIYDSAGECVKTLAFQTLNKPITQSYSWDGTNQYGDACASGIYILDLTEPFDNRQKKVILIH